ncbi:hypothetical protein ASC89_23225 [Devosia sp. Root413D1]|uniref:hypothetical protein n=1 Tax=Devosia sp. Root413D1 TaxID=1736531 RepID=UPI0006FBFCEB|nr:hypothetical protein [Devosia sp. Root413D1]KQW75838.1 hypothetical protein ASC89_23225 [Devosia sp. Root413D1]
MSNYHTYADDCRAPAPSVQQVAGDAISLVRSAIHAVVSALRHARARRATEDRVTGFPAHLLADLGYERDWDGSIHPVRNEDA